jgi:dCTP deaminase
MCILTKDEILREIREGNIIIEPFSEDQVGPGSVDLHLGSEFRIFKKLHNIYHVVDNSDFNEVTELISGNDYFVLMPGESVLGITLEKITLPPYLSGWLEGRSRFARLGLMVHITASFMHPGIDNHQVLELSNVSPMPLALHPGTMICQFIFEKTIGHATYRGIFARQTSP